MENLQPLIKGSHILPDEVVNIASEEDKKSEEYHFYSVISSFANYEQNSFLELSVLQRQWDSVDEKYKSLLPDYSKKFDYIKSGIKANYNFIMAVIGQYVKENLADPRIFSANHIRHVTPKIVSQKKPEIDMVKVKGTLKQCVREWGEEGREERNGFALVIKHLNTNFPNIHARQKVRVLTPGCGLGRLTYEIAREGYRSEGCEFSFYMLLTSEFIINHSVKGRKFGIYPYIHQRSNTLEISDQVRGVFIPDVDLSAGTKGDFSMTMGEFYVVYRQPKYIGSFDALVTYFFMDTATNVFHYVEVVHQTLKKGGLWINYGPLLYHFSDTSKKNSSVELTYEELKAVVTKMGFMIETEGLENSSYSSNMKSMMKVVYTCGFFVAKKM